MRFTFPKTERLTSKKVIDRLFHRPKPGEAAPVRAKNGPDEPPETFYLFPFRVIYFRQPIPPMPDAAVAEGVNKPETPALAPPQVLFSVPKRAFKKAVDRNAIRRRIREAYRLHKHTLMQPPASIAFLYTAKAKISFEEIEKGMKLALKRIKNDELRIKNGPAN
ncbi:ribonuclease P protein component [Fibrella aquatilis]|uniref:Ribonuclease P protein component n=1 Tax=Fibrella aquatilis TaxID=2817059 RepID=A0A939G2D7_9BACT|nr:ribonuclease P protein component [Fibrella aquatilis]MBO0930631.1 ribonuclease P protein component [Fibrella aquatilis]